MKEYFEYTDFQAVEDETDSLNTEISAFTLIPTFTKKTWALNDFPYVQEVDRIERGIENLIFFLPYPTNYVSKTWISYYGEHPLLNFSWSDYVRWLLNLQLIDEYKDKIEIRYSSEGYSGDTIWL